jgi:hypothetical protein
MICTENKKKKLQIGTNSNINSEYVSFILKDDRLMKKLYQFEYLLSIIPTKLFRS